VSIPCCKKIPRRTFRR